MADIKQVVQWLREGKAIKRPHWCHTEKSDTIYLGKRNSTQLLGRVGSLCWLENLSADDWEIAE